MSGYEDAAQQCADAGLPLPYIPQRLRDSLTAYGEWLYATDGDIVHQNQLALFGLLQDDRLPDFARLMQVGHGSNSWVIRYEVALRPLVLLLDYPWGGAYTPGDAAAIGAKFDAARRLLEAVEAGSTSLAADEYLVVLETPATGGQWLRLRVPSAQNPMALSWQPSQDALADALEQLTVAS